MAENLVPDPFVKIKTEHICRSTVSNVKKFDFILCPSEGLPKCLKTRMLTTCFYLIKTF